MTADKTDPAKRRRTITSEDPAIIAKAIPDMTGPDFIRRIKEGRVPTLPIFRLIDFRFAGVDVRRVVFEMTPGEYHYNPAGAVHGGVTCTVLDSAATCAAHSTLPPSMVPATLEIKINYLHPIINETGTMRCEGALIHKGNRTVVAEARMLDAEGLLYAYAASTCLIFDATKEGAKPER
jgi:uncharacterized protein (TIGR00369 family)